MSTKGFAVARGEFTGERSGDAQQQRVQDIEQVLNGIPFLRGKLHRAVAFTAYTDKVLTHNFGRLAGAMVLGVDLAGTATPQLFAIAVQPDSDTRIVLQTTANCTLDIWLWPRGT